MSLKGLITAGNIHSKNRNLKLNVCWSRKCKSNMHLPQELIEWLLHNYSNEVVGLHLIKNYTVTSVKI